MYSRILPVIDLKRGKVVHGVAGERASYRPIVSKLVNSLRPGEVAKALCDSVGSRDLYVADLDALDGQEPDWNSHSTIASHGLDIWLDAGIRDLNAIQQIVVRQPCRVIVALECLQSLHSLDEIVRVFSDQRLTFSLDLYHGQPRLRDGSASNLSAETIASYASDVGVTSMIVLDVTVVGTNAGSEHSAGTVDLCRKIRARHPKLELVSGGGVRDVQDVERFVDAGCDRVLVATALHNQAIPQRE